MNPRLKRYIAAVGDLPSVPPVASAVMRVVSDQNASAEDLRRVLERDPSLAARILKVANSSLYSFSRRIETLQHAVALLGFRTVSNTVLAASLRDVFKYFGLAEKLLWEHSTLAGAAASRLAMHCDLGVDRELAFTAGLLHDLGKIAFNNASREEYTRVIARVYNEATSFTEAERAEFGFDHAELGACVVAKWKLGKGLETAIRYHHDPDALEVLPPAERQLTALTAVTTACCTRLGVGRRVPVESLDIAALPASRVLAFSAEDVEDILSLVSEELKRAEGLFE